MLKSIVLQILDEWECKMQDKDVPRSLIWRSSVVPRNDTIVMFRRQRGTSSAASHQAGGDE